VAGGRIAAGQTARSGAHSFAPWSPEYRWAPEYGFLLARYVDEATLERACRLAERSGVHPHHVLIANGWLEEADYYAALAAACGTDFKPEITAQDVAPPTPNSSPRECLTKGLLRERRRRGHVVFAPEDLRPDRLPSVCHGESEFNRFA
jgi:hypothetical protein